MPVKVKQTTGLRKGGIETGVLYKISGNWFFTTSGIESIATG